jgi:glycosyltransferase involved in cell wall biosynthesis
LLPRAVASVLDQSWRDFELLIVDDGSTDGTEAVVAAFEDPRVRSLHGDHQGASAARNRGAEAAQGRYLVFLDSDDAALPSWLGRLYGAISTGHPDLVVCGMEGVGSDGTVRWRWIPGPGELGVGDVAVHFEAGQVALRRELFVRSGGFAPALRYGENTELALRLLCGTTPPPRIASVPEVLVRVRPVGADQDYSTARADSARYVLEHHRRWRRQVPHLWASYHAISGADLARRGLWGLARRQFAAAVATDPRWEHIRRLVVAAVPPVARSVWPVLGATASGSAGKGPVGSDAEVLFVALASGLGGSMRSLATVLTHLDGHRRVVACPAPTTFTDLIDRRGVFEERLVVPGGGPSRPGARLSALLTVTAHARRNRHRLAAIHANGLAERNLVAAAAAVSRTPVVVWVHDWSVSPWSRRLAPLIELITPETRFAAVSPEAAAMLAEAGIATADRVSVVANPIDPLEVRAEGRPAPPPPPPPAGDRVTVGYLGTPAHYKGFHLLPPLISCLAGEPLRWVLYAGPASAMPDVWEQLRTMTPEIDIDLPGKVIDVRDAYAACDIVVCPSLHESFGRVVAEAMANGVPVVASDLPPLRRLVGDDEAGLLVPPGDVAAAAAAIRTLAADADRRHRLGTNGVGRVRSYAPSAIVAQLERLYGLR